MQTVRIDTLTESERDAVRAAKACAERAHAPYSGFVVGAALVSEGATTCGCNVENASYGLTICAERNAASTAIASGEKFFLMLAIYTPTPRPTTPCGACRQFLAEFAPQLRILMACDGDEVVVTTLDVLLPHGFDLEPTEQDDR